MKTRLYCLIGPDGVGKTTHAYKIVNLLKNRGLHVEYRWFRFFHFFSTPLLLYCRLTGLTKYETKEGYRNGRHEFYKSKTVSHIYPWILFFDMCLSYLVKIFLPIHLGTVLVCDRFIYDTLADLMLDLKDFRIHKQFIGALFIRLIPKDSKVVLIKLDQEHIKQRRKDLINDQLFIDKDKAYSQLAKNFNIPIVNNKGNIRDVHQEIIDIFGLNI